mmetsp:Transcript_26952/g.71387  ORF Transcript_26952/g.71387 Transcript_26952/m.71387 type:complete len:134 (-) Transcript_26952:403-804(-)
MAIGLVSNEPDAKRWGVYLCNKSVWRGGECFDPHDHLDKGRPGPDVFHLPCHIELKADLTSHRFSVKVTAAAESGDFNTAEGYSDDEGEDVPLVQHLLQDWDLGTISTDLPQDKKLHLYVETWGRDGLKAALL